MLQDDFEKLMKQFEGADPTKVNMEEIMRQVLHFFDSLKQDILKASPEEREEIFSKLTSMYTQLMGMTSKLAARMGMSEQDLLKMAEEMKNFTPEQRDLIEKTKSKMMSEVADLGKVLQQPKKEGEEKKGPPPPPKPGAKPTRWERA